MIKFIRPFGDSLAISLSMLCTIHCLLLPVILVWLPTQAVLLLEDESFHLGMLALVIPCSLLSLALGCHKHRNFRLFALGALGVVALILAITPWAEIIVAEGETVFTVVGAGLIAIAHLINFRLCRQHDCYCADSANCP